MSNYTKSTDFASKDNLTSGDPLKIVKGTEIDTEFNNIATAVATKADTAGPTFTGTVTIPTIALTNDLAVADGGTGASTATDARTNLSAAKSGSNSDITALSGLTTALSVAQGGTGATSITSGALVKGAGTSAFSAASAADIVGQIGSTAVANATNASTVTTVTTAQVLAAIASASVGAVGTYAMVEYASAGNRTLNPGDVVSGSDLRYAGVQTHITIGYNVLDAGQYGSTLSGSWRIMGYAESNNGSNGQPATLALRIS